MTALRTLPADDPRHGTVNAYNNYDCRCLACWDARRIASAAYHAARKANAALWADR